jgi:Uma2 family endonuclease
MGGVLTADELLHMPDDDFRYELVGGRLIRMSPTGSVHGAIAGQLAAALINWLDQRDLGHVFVETGFHLAVDPDTVRAPDVSFVEKRRIPPGGIPRAYWRGAPDLAIEVLSPDDSPREMDEKVREYLDHGARAVWVVDPDAHAVTVHGSDGPPQTVREPEWLNGGLVLPGFRCSLAQIFKGLG